MLRWKCQAHSCTHWGWTIAALGKVSKQAGVSVCYLGCWWQLQLMSGSWARRSREEKQIAKAGFLFTATDFQHWHCWIRKRKKNSEADKTLNTILKLFATSPFPLKNKIYIHMVASFVFLLGWRDSSLYAIPNHAEHFNMFYLFLNEY